MVRITEDLLHSNYTTKSKCLITISHTLKGMTYNPRLIISLFPEFFCNPHFVSSVHVTWASQLVITMNWSRQRVNHLWHIQRVIYIDNRTIELIWIIFYIIYKRIKYFCSNIYSSNHLILHYLNFSFRKDRS